AYSGGRDSTVVLTLLRDHGIRSVAVLIDNGAIPDPVKQRSTVICDRLNVELRVVHIDIGRTLRQFLSGEAAREPCQVCIGRGLHAMAREARKLNIHVIVSGHKYAPSSHQLDLLTHDPFDADIVMKRPLALTALTTEDRDHRLRSVDWYDVPFTG